MKSDRVYYLSRISRSPDLCYPNGVIDVHFRNHRAVRAFVFVLCESNPEAFVGSTGLAPVGHLCSFEYDRLRALITVWPVLVIFLAVVLGIYFGFFTPTEAAAVGAAGTCIAALASGNMNLAKFKQANKMFQLFPWEGSSPARSLLLKSATVAASST